MNAPVHSRTFKSGNGVAVRLPVALAIDAGTNVEIVRRGSELVLKPLRDPATERADMIALVERLRKIGAFSAAAASSGCAARNPSRS